MEADRISAYVTKALSVAFATGLLLAAAPAAAQPHGGDRGGGQSYSGGGRGGDGGNRGGGGGYRGNPGGGGGGGGYRGNPGNYNRGGYTGGYRGNPGTYNHGGYTGGGDRTGYFGHRTVNNYYVRNPEAYGGRWEDEDSGRWYDGYWHNYWDNASWLWWGGHYGFWFPFNGIDVFVYEVSPDVCQYWDGYEWVPYYDPQYGYYCPY